MDKDKACAVHSHHRYVHVNLAAAFLLTLPFHTLTLYPQKRLASPGKGLLVSHTLRSEMEDGLDVSQHFCNTV